MKIKLCSCFTIKFKMLNLLLFTCDIINCVKNDFYNTLSIRYNVNLNNTKLFNYHTFLLVFLYLYKK